MLRYKPKRGERDRPPKGFWRWNIRNPYQYARGLKVQVEKWEGKKLTARRLQQAIEEDSHDKISLRQCQLILKRVNK